jgi:Arm DNA-binding domain
MADKRQLTDRFLKSLAPAKPGTRNDIWDSVVPTFGACIYDSKDADPSRRGKAGRIAFIMYTRFKRGAAPARRIIGFYPATSLENARRTAGEWRSLIAKGIDPAAVEKANREKAAREAALRVQHSFAAVAETFIADKMAQERDGKDAARVMRSVFVAAWADRPIADITALDVLEIINAKKRRAPQQARALLVLARRFFNWCVDQHVYGLDRSPCDRIKPNSIIGPVPKRNRRLSDIEIAAFWRATGRMKYPVGPVYRALLLTGLRLNECAQLSWPEL